MCFRTQWSRHTILTDTVYGFVSTVDLGSNNVGAEGDH